MDDPEAYVFAEVYRTVYEHKQDHNDAEHCAKMAVSRFRESQKYRR